MSLSRMTAGLSTSEVVAAPVRTIALGFDELPVPTLQEAIEPLIQPLIVIPGVQMLAKSLYDQVEEAKKAGGSFESDALSADGITALMLYSSEDLSPPLYRDMNSKCYIKNRDLVRPYSKYLWLLHDSLKTIEPYEGSTIFRGVKLDLKSHYPKGRKVIWHGPSSCTRAIDVLSTDQFLGSTGVGTIFVVELTQHQARDISKYSLMPEEYEIILPAGSKFEVVGQLSRGDLTTIHLREVQSDDIFMDLQEPHSGNRGGSRWHEEAPSSSVTVGGSGAKAARHLREAPASIPEAATAKATASKVPAEEAQRLRLEAEKDEQDRHAEERRLEEGHLRDVLLEREDEVETLKAKLKVLAEEAERLRLKAEKDEQDRRAEERRLKAIFLEAIFLDGLSPEQREEAQEQGPTMLCLPNMGLHSRGVRPLAEALKMDGTLEDIDLKRNNLGDEGAEYISKALQENHTLQRIDLAHNEIGYIGAEYISEALQENHTLQFINLSCNNIRDTGAEYISKALQENHTLQSINLGGNKIGDTGAEYISKALQENHTLERIYLKNNQIGDIGAEHISSALLLNNTLRVISLSWNIIGDLGAEYISKALQENHTLVWIMLDRNQIGDIGAEYISKALQKNHTLQRIDLDDNQIGDIGRRALERAERPGLTIHV